VLIPLSTGIFRISQLLLAPRHVLYGDITRKNNPGIGSEFELSLDETILHIVNT